MSYTRQICVSSDNNVPHTNEGRNESGKGDFAGEVLVDSRLENSSEVHNESILLSVPLPVVMAVNSAAIVSLAFSRRNIRKGFEPFKTIVSCGYRHLEFFATAKDLRRGLA